MLEMSVDLQNYSKKESLNPWRVPRPKNISDDFLGIFDIFIFCKVTFVNLSLLVVESFYSRGFIWLSCIIF